MKKLVIFDLDGTLLDTSEGLNVCMNAALTSCGLKEISVEDTKRYVGNGTKIYVEKAVGNGVDTKKCFDAFSDKYRDLSPDGARLYDGMDELFRTLEKSGIKMAILSNKPHDFLDAFYQRYLKKYAFSYVLGYKEGGDLKPRTGGVEEILTALNISRKDCVLVGDGETDVITARNAGMDFIAVTWGFRTKKQLTTAGARIFADNADELQTKILFQFGRKKMRKFFKDFRAFISRGNVLDMAVGVIIGSAFSAIVTSLVKDVITPLISLITGDVSLTELKWVLRQQSTEMIDGVETIKTAELALNYGSFLQAIINFLLIALSVFLFVKIIIAIKKRLDINETFRSAVQKKLDSDQTLSAIEQKWLDLQIKKDPESAPKKAAPVEPAAPPAPTETEKLLSEILAELKNKD